MYARVTTIEISPHRLDEAIGILIGQDTMIHSRGWEFESISATQCVRCYLSVVIGRHCNKYNAFPA